MQNKESGILFKGIVAIVLSVFVTLALAEIGLRAADAAGLFPELFSYLGRAKPPLDRADGPGMYYAHPYSAYALKPGYISGNFQKINSLGFRGDEFPFKKPAGTYRIIAIGGSTTFGVYVDWNKSFPYYLQEKLRQDFGNDSIEVINAGLTGSTTAESLHRLFTQILPLNPDMVIVYHAYNDLFPRVFSNFRPDYYHFRRSNPNNPPGLARFYVYRLALKVINPWAFAGDNDLTSVVWNLRNLPDSDSVRVENFYTSDSSVFETNMEYIVTTLQVNGVQPVLATFSISPDAIHWNDYIPAFLWEEGIRQNNEAIRRVAREFDVPLVPFAAKTAGLPSINPWKKQKDGCCFNDSIHMTAEGNILKANIFSETIVPIIKEAKE